MIQPFTLHWPAADIARLRAQLASVELPDAPPGAGWSLGCDIDFLERFRAYVLNDLDWDRAQATLNRYPQFVADVDGVAIHFVHVKGECANARPLLLTHGWPGSHFEFWDVIEPLTRPSAHGGRAQDAFDVIIPTLPGYGFSDSAFSGSPAQPIGPKGTAALWDRLMTQVLGYNAYLAQGGDWGALVTAQLGLISQAVRGIHLNLVGLRSTAAPQNAAEKDWAAKAAQAYAAMSGYSVLQRTKPMSLALASAGNPLGQAAWIIERFHDWADLSERSFEDVFPLEHLAINALIYLMPGQGPQGRRQGSFASSLLFYNGLEREGGINLSTGERCEVPSGYANFPGDALMPPPPRSRMELCFNLVHWTDMPRGGHFAAMEQPGLFAADVTDFAGKVWPPA